MQFFHKLINWYFNKKSLPYWCVFLFDCAIVFFSFLLVYQQTYDGAKTLSVLWQLCSMCAIYGIFYAVGFKMFHTYDGILRYSSFVDLQRVGYASLVGCVLSYLGHFVMLQFDYFQNVYVGGREIALASLISVLLLWAVRVLVKTVYDVSIDTFNARPTVILGIDEGGIGLAKLVRRQVAAHASLRLRVRRQQRAPQGAHGSGCLSVQRREATREAGAHRVSARFAGRHRRVPQGQGATGYAYS